MPVPADATEYILGELTRRLNEVASRLEVGMTRMDGVFVRKDVYDQWQATLKQELDSIRRDITAAEAALKVTDASITSRVAALEESRQWLFRLSVGAVVSGLGSIVVAAITVAVK